MTVPRVEFEFKIPMSECRKISKNWQMWTLFLLQVHFAVQLIHAKFGFPIVHQGILFYANG